MKVKLVNKVSPWLAVGLIVLVLGITSLTLFGFSKYLLQKILILNKVYQNELTLNKDLTDLVDRKKAEASYQLFSYSPSYYPNELENGEKYSLECYKETYTLIPQWPWRNDLNQTLLKGEKIIEVCYNKELNSVVYWTSQPTERSQDNYRPFNEKLSLKIYNPNSKMDYSIIEEMSGIHGSCDSVLGWTKSGHIYYQCNSGFDFSSGKKTLFVSVARRNLVTSCTSGYQNNDPRNPQVEACISYCQKDSDCGKGYLCNSKENVCMKHCNADSDCLTSCGTSGNSYVCKFSSY